MSAKLRIKSQKNENGRLNWVEIWKKGRRKPLRLDFVWDAKGLTREIEFSGSKRDMPSLADIMLMFNQSFIERIGLINLIKEIRSVRIIGKDASDVERRSTISNHGVIPLWVSRTGDNRAGKFFTRGMMGFINTIDIFCKDEAAAGGTITVYISPNPSLGYVASATVTVPAGGEPAWRSATFNRMWLSDKLFVFYVDSADIADARDAEDSDKNDWYQSTDAGATWTHADFRPWVRVVMKGETEGDANVTGTVNTIEIPTVTGSLKISQENIDGGLTEPLINLAGSGEVNGLMLRILRSVGSVPRINTFLRFTVDGVLTEIVLDSLVEDVDGVVNTPTDITFTSIDDTADAQDHRLNFRKPFKFLRSFKLEIKNTAAAGNQLIVDGHYFPNLING